MEEIWKDIVDFPGIYQVSNTGRIRRIVDNFGNALEKYRILKPHLVRGYASVALSKQPEKKKNYLVHRLVAAAFVPNPHLYKEVNHKDENKLNNLAENLEWCSRSYNMAYGTARVRQGVSCGHSVYQLTVSGVRIAAYSSAEVAGKITGIDPSSIHKCCTNKRDYAGGYKWVYAGKKLF